MKGLMEFIKLEEAELFLFSELRRHRGELLGVGLHLTRAVTQIPKLRKILAHAVLRLQHLRARAHLTARTFLETI